ncbi:hypothetical protein [Embleya sp. NPDC059237]|uniref:hypothetical protein n=1 Tax=Embleya sp. NPDC059237 TaxID=3346784 RepID=UPI003686A2B1
MSMSFFWRRASAEAVSCSAPHELLELVPYWHQRPELWNAGLVTGVEFHFSVLDRVLVECCPDQVSAELVVHGGEPRTDLWASPDGEVQEHTVVTTLTPEQVTAAAEALRCAPCETRLCANPRRMTALVEELEFTTPWHDDWERRVVHDLAKLTGFYRAAADSRRCSCRTGPVLDEGSVLPELPKVSARQGWARWSRSDTGDRSPGRAAGFHLARQALALMRSGSPISC